MILELIQTRSNFGSSYEVYTQGSRLYQIAMPINANGVSAALMQDGKVCYTLKFERQDHIKDMQFNEFAMNVLPFKVLDANGEPCGILGYKPPKLFDGTDFYLFDFKGKKITIHFVGMGKQGKFLILFDGDMQIGLIEKQLVVEDNKDVYTHYVESAYCELAIIFNLYYDYVNYGQLSPMVYKTKKIELSYTLNKKQKSKYNPKFKEQFL